MSVFTELQLYVLSDRLAVCKLSPITPFPEWAKSDDLLAFVRTKNELSIVCSEGFVPLKIKSEPGWRALQVKAELDFSMVGLLAALTGILAQAGVSVFTISTYDTDYILVKDNELPTALAALTQSGYTVVNHVSLPS